MFILLFDDKGLSMMLNSDKILLTEQKEIFFFEIPVFL